MARKVRTTTTRCVLIDDQLYKTICNWPLLKCVNEEDRMYFLREIHEGIRSSHIGTKALVNKAPRY